MNPNGRFHKLNYDEFHSSWARNYLRDNNIPFEKNMIQSSMFKLGFLRIVTTDDVVIVEYNKDRKPSNLQWRNLKDASIEAGLNLFDDITGKKIELYESLLKEEILNNNRDYWMDTKGRFLRAKEGHFEWAMNYLTAHNIPHGYDPNTEDLEKSPDDIYIPLFKLGFLRIKVHSNSIFVNYLLGKPPTNFQWRTLKDTAIESDMKLIDAGNHNLAGRDIELNEEQLSSRQEYWLDKNGRFHRASGGHAYWASQFLSQNKIKYNNLDDYNDSIDNPGCYYVMYSLGFYRIYIDENIIHANNKRNIPPTNSQLRNLRDSSIENRKELAINNKLIDLSESKYVNRDNRQLFIEHMNPDNIDEFKINLAELFSYLQKKLKLKTIPKVKLNSDEKNASKILGKTAYYNPEEKEVVLYTTDRHQKDILRSFSHEIIHHWQHENQKLQSHEKTKGEGTSDPEYAQKDPWLRQMEKQAYLLGNICFRDWEDNKKAKDRKSGKKNS
jgi:hypothetical protein